ncbi:MAG: class I SAM-dependent methyltransferase [bacterium]
MNLWDWKAEFYDSSRKIFPFNQILFKEVENLKRLLSYITLNGMAVLDVGTGPGTNLHLLQKSACLYAVDRSFRMICKARKKLPIVSVVADSTRLPFKPRSFNLITAIGLLEYQERYRDFLREVQRLLTFDGLVLLTFSPKGWLNLLRNFLGHRLYLTSQEDFNIAACHAGFEIVEFRESLLQRQVLLVKKHAE